MTLHHALGAVYFFSSPESCWGPLTHVVDPNPDCTFCAPDFSKLLCPAIDRDGKARLWKARNPMLGGKQPSVGLSTLHGLHNNSEKVTVLIHNLAKEEDEALKARVFFPISDNTWFSVIKGRCEGGWCPNDLQLNPPGFSQPMRLHTPAVDSESLAPQAPWTRPHNMSGGCQRPGEHRDHNYNHINCTWSNHPLIHSLICVH